MNAVFGLSHIRGIACKARKKANTSHIPARQNLHKGHDFLVTIQQVGACYISATGGAFGLRDLQHTLESDAPLLDTHVDLVQLSADVAPHLLLDLEALLL